MGCRHLLLVLLVALAALLPGSRCSLAAESAPPRRLALLVGVSKYRQLGSQPWPRLHTEGEIQALREVLLQHYQFAASDVRVLQDEEATGDNIRKVFYRHLVEQARPGDTVLFHFSGHGQQLADDNGDEADGLDESLVPMDSPDSTEASGRRYNIRDDTLARWLADLQARMRSGGKGAGSIVVTVDSCFSGTVTRYGVATRGRGWDPSRDGVRPAPKPSSTPDGASGLLPDGRAGRLGYVLLAAARSDQSATSRPGSGQGRFTQALTQALKEMAGLRSVTYRQLMERIVTEVASEVDDQEPQMEGDREALLFAGGEHSADRQGTIPARRTQDGQLQLLAGEILGVSKGSVYRLYPVGSPALDETTQLGEAVVEQVDALRATLKPRPHSELAAQLASLKGAIAREVEHDWSQAPLRVYWPYPEPCQALHAPLMKQRFVTQQGASAEDYDLRVRCLPQPPRVLLFHAGTNKPFAELAQGAATPDKLIEKVSRAWSWRHYLSLHRYNPDAQVQLRILPVTEPTGPPGTPEATPAPILGRPAATKVTLRTGEYFMLEFTNLSPKPLFVTVLDIGDDGAVKTRYPEGSELGNSLVQNSTQHGPYKPPSYLFHADHPGRHLLKLLATTEPLDVNGIDAPATAEPLRSGSAGSTIKPPLRNLLKQLANISRGPRTRSVASAPTWGTAEAWLEIVP